MWYRSCFPGNALVVLVYLTVATSQSVHSKIEGKIVGGTPSGSSAVAVWQVSLLVNNEKLCGGVILSNSIIATAAHCVKNILTNDTTLPQSVVVCTGNDRRNCIQHLSCARLWIHASYDSSTASLNQTDLAVLETESPIIFSNQVGPISLADSSCTECEISSANYLVTGFGQTSISGPTENQMQFIFQWLVKEADDRISRDNISVVVVDLQWAVDAKLENPKTCPECSAVTFGMTYCTKCGLPWSGVEVDTSIRQAPSVKGKRERAWKGKKKLEESDEDVVQVEIGAPTNVVHTSHAQNEAELRRLLHQTK